MGKTETDEIDDYIAELELEDDDEEEKPKKKGGKKKTAAKPEKKTAKKEKGEPKEKTPPKKKLEPKEGNICSEIVDLDSLGVDPDNRNVTPEAIDSLACSIKELGMLVPILIDDTGVIIDGERRYHALIKLGEKTAEVVRVKKASPKKIDPMQYAVNCVRENFDLKKQREIFQSYKDQGKTQKEIAKLFGVTQGRISQVLSGKTGKADGKKKESAPVTSFEPAEGLKITVGKNSTTYAFEVGKDISSKNYKTIEKHIVKIFREGSPGTKKDIDSIRKGLK